MDNSQAMQYLFVAAIVKGLVEHEDGCYFFVRSGAYKVHLAEAIALNVVEADGKTVTTKGQAWYSRNLATIGRNHHLNRGEKILNCLLWPLPLIGKP